MHLLSDSWLPVRRRDGCRDWVAPDQLTDPDIVAFDADRADFNGALAQFVIGLLQTTTPVDSDTQWKALLTDPPNRETLRGWFAPATAAFEFEGTGARFMQDFSLRIGDGEIKPISALLIETPGENALRNNSDHFIKRAQIDALCPDCAALALLTLQINAPSGGAGHRTSLRGGGPLTTLLLSQPPCSLWHDLWLNVQPRSQFLGRAGNVQLESLVFTFPWLADIGAIQKDGSETAPAQVHPNHVFWAMPRRIRLDIDNVTTGTCGVCCRHSDRLISHYITKNYGLNYKGAWDHPLSPYYEIKEDWLPLHPQPGGLGYRHWLAWVLGQTGSNKKRPAGMLTYALEHRQRAMGGGLRIWAFGYDMDNMKARCWYESSLPLYKLADCSKEGRSKLSDAASTSLAGAELAGSYLRGAVKDAWFSGDARGDFSAIDASFWGQSEGAFYRQIKETIDILSADEQAEVNPLPARQAWHALLVKTALKLFDSQFVGSGQIERQKPARVAGAFQQLKKNLYGPKLRTALRLPETEKSKPETQSAKKAA